MWWWFKKILASLSLGIFLVCTSCGYTFNHRLSDRFNHPKGIYVPIFYNGTEQVGAEIAFTNALIRKLLSHGEKVVYNESESGLILKGTIQSLAGARQNDQSIDTDSLYTYNRIPDQILVSASIRLTLLETETKNQLWTQEYPHYILVGAPHAHFADADAPSSFSLITQSKIDASYADIARDFASSAYNSMVEIYYGKK